MPGVTSGMIAGMMRNAPKLVNMQEVLPTIAALNPQVLLTLGAGDIDTLVSPIKALLLRLNPSDHG
ncbi:MAG: hypothetical protein R2795_07030 [Saprospiraceae bacterium]